MSAIYPAYPARMPSDFEDLETAIEARKVELKCVDDENNGSRGGKALVDSLRPLLGSMTLFGLYFNCRSEITGDSKAANRSGKWKLYTIYSAIVVIALWLNAVRMWTIFTSDDEFGMVLIYKSIHVIWPIHCAMLQTAFYAGSRLGRFEDIFSGIYMTSECERYARKIGFAYAATTWSLVVIASGLCGYGLFAAINLPEVLLTPIDTHIVVSNTLVPRIIVSVVTIYLLAAHTFPQATTFLLAMIFSHQFVEVDKELGRCLDNQQGRLSESDVEKLRQQHQKVSMSVSRTDDCLMFSNASAFCCQLAIVILLLYVMMFYHSSISDPVHITAFVFWFLLQVAGLTFTAAGGIIVNYHAHKICERVHDVKLASLSGPHIGKVNVFLSRLNGDPIGFSVLGIFVIDKNTILTLIGLLITYFLLIVQLSNSWTCSPSASNATSSD